jgi:Flp pilus assembly protein TadD/predicted Zn-dependent protease with MMP-like domain
VGRRALRHSTSTLGAFLLLLCACKGGDGQVRLFPGDAGVPARTASGPTPPGPGGKRDEPRADLRLGDHRLDEHDDEVDGVPPDGKPVVECPIADKLDVDAALDMAASKYDGGDFNLALACADRAVRVSPRSVEAHHNRGLALAALERWDEARQAFTHALAIDPNDPETLAGAADLYINRVPPGRDMTELGLEYARRGSAHVGGRREDLELAGRLALLEAQALDDLGQTDEALLRAEAAVSLDAHSVDSRYERAVVLFHMCRFERAREAFNDLARAAPDDPFVLYHLGMVLEREGRQPDADKLFARAHALAADKFPDPAGMVTAAEFQAMVDHAIAVLPAHLKQAVKGVAIEVADLPAVDDLLAVDPPFAPTILGLYRGAPVGARTPPPAAGAKPGVASAPTAASASDDEADEPRSIVLYRKNLARAVTSRAELEKQVRITLWHEIGHLRGADEDDLRERGLE